MSQSSISKYISLLREEVEIFEWWKNNCPIKDVNWENEISQRISDADYFASHYAVLATFDANFNSSYNSREQKFGTALSLGSWGYRDALYNWIKNLSDSDREKACLFLCKIVNKNKISDNDDYTYDNRDLRDARNFYDYFEELEDYRSLPLKQIFFKAFAKNYTQYEGDSVFNFAEMALENSYYADVFEEFGATDESSRLLSWILLPFEEGDISIQITPKSYTQVGNQNLRRQDPNYLVQMRENTDWTKKVIYFNNSTGEPVIEESLLDSEEYFQGEKINDLEQYALEIQNNSTFSLENIKINTFLDRACGIINFGKCFVNQDQKDGKLTNKSLSQRLVFDIANQKSVIVPSADLYQSLMYLRRMGTEDISLYYDSVERAVIIKGKDIEGIKRDPNPKYNPAVRIGGEPSFLERKFIIPTFAIIYEQDEDDYTPLSGIEYIEFFNEELSFRDKYDLLNTKIYSPIELPDDFKEEYPFIARSYDNQISVSLSSVSREEKYDFCIKSIENYINSYTEIEVKYKVPDLKTGNWNGKWTSVEGDGIEGSQKIFRKPIESVEWQEPSYVLSVNEAYWIYNSDISTEEILAFFVSKGNDINYRILSLKILGLDYHLFESPIINSLIQSGEMYVSNMDLDEANITANVDYQSRNGFVSGNIYRKQETIQGQGQDVIKYAEDLKIFFGEDLGVEIYENSSQTIDEAISNRFIPSLVPKVENEQLQKSLELNVDIFNRIFFQGVSDLTNSSSVPVRSINTVLSTGTKVNRMKIETKNGRRSSNYPYGHFELFSNWLGNNRSQILGTFTSEEIKEAYIFPVQPPVFIFRYILTKFKDSDGDVVGYKCSFSKNIVTMVRSAREETRLVLASLGLIADKDSITAAEAKSIANNFKLAYKERFWEARREGRRLFNYFLKNDLTPESQSIIDFEWNKMYNNYAKPDLLKTPMFPSHSYLFGKRKNASKLVLAEAQKEGIRHVLSRKNSGLFLHEVGFGKTTSSITAISSMMNTGETSRALFLVPNSVYDKFQDEIVGNSEAYGLLPNVNIVLLDGLTEVQLMSSKSNNGLGIKVFSDAEKKVMKEFKSFVTNFVMPSKTDKGVRPKHLGNQCRIFSNLKRNRVTFEDESSYTALSNWDAARQLIDKAFDSTVKSLNSPILQNHLNKLDELYRRIESEWDRFKRPLLEIIYENQSNVSAGIKLSAEEKQNEEKAKKDLDEKALTLSRKLSKSINRYMRFANSSLIDELGYYKPQVMQEKTILVAKHSAAEKKLRPSNEAVMRALMFKNGKGSIVDVPDSLLLEDWADASGEDSNTRLTQAKVKSAVNILETHPISFEKLNIDTVVVDEIHNFNNIVVNTGTYGFAGIDGGTFTQGGQRRNDYNQHFPLMPNSGRKENNFAMKYDSKGRGSDSKGSKLTTTAICFQVQATNPKVNNVLLLSATPFTDTPFQVLSVLGMSNYEMLIDNGIKSGWDFFNNYIDEIYKYDIQHDGGYGLFIDVNGYYNDKALSNLITNVANVKITDEKIEANRPKKAIIPANKMKKADDGVASTASPQMGDQFEELEFCNSRVEMSEEQTKFQELIQDYLSDDSKQMKVNEIFPVNETRRERALTAEEEAKLDEELKEDMEKQFKEAKDNPDDADLIVMQLEELYERSAQYKRHPLIKKTIDNIKKKILKEDVEVDDDEVVEGTAEQSQLTNIQRLAGKAISCQQAQTSLVLSPYMVNLGDKAYTSKFLKPLEPNPSKVFVESSPKLMFVVKSISQTLKYQTEQLQKGEIEKIGGQVIYFDRHKFDYGGKSYNGFDLLAEYLVENIDELSSEKDNLGNYIEVAQITGKTNIEDKFKGKKDNPVLISKGRKSIKDEFNEGKIKILLGSKAIKEGIDLQGNSHTMYICEAEFSPEVAMQLEGRIWRQKNPYDVVRVIYVLMMNTIDSFIYSKINRKVSAIKRMLELGVYEMGTTQFVIDTKEMLLQLESDPDKLTAIQFQDEIKVLKDFIAVKEKQIARLNYLSESFETVSTRYESNCESLSVLYKKFGEACEIGYKAKTITTDIKKTKLAIKKQDHENSGTKKNMVEWTKGLSDAERKKYEVTDAEIESAYAQALSEKPMIQPFKNYENANFTIETPFSELQMVAQKIRKNLDLVSNIQQEYAGMNSEDQKQFLDKESKNKSELMFIAFVNHTGSTQVYNYQQQLMKNYETNVDDINLIKDYQSFVLNNEGISSIADIQKVIDEEISEFKVSSDKVNNEDKFKADLRAQWVVALEERKEVSGGTMEEIVETMKGSLPLIKLRQK